MLTRKTWWGLNVAATTSVISLTSASAAYLFIFTLLTRILKASTSPGVAFTCSPVPDTWMYEGFSFRLINNLLMAYLSMEINHGSIGG